MHVESIDHVNLRIPADGAERALGFYRDVLEFDAENVDLYESGEKPFFSIRLSGTAVLHLLPTDEFEAPDDASYNHVALSVAEPIGAVTETLREAGVEIEAELAEPLGATGTAPAVYVRDPFGYRVELKQATWVD